MLRKSLDLYQDQNDVISDNPLEAEVDILLGADELAPTEWFRLIQTLYFFSFLPLLIFLLTETHNLF